MTKEQIFEQPYVLQMYSMMLKYQFEFVLKLPEKYYFFTKIHKNEIFKKSFGHTFYFIQSSNGIN